MAAGRVERIAHYRILKRIGRGGMGIVYRALDERDGRLVALKVIRESETSGDDDAAHAHEARVRFEREAEILRGLLHVNVVAFYEIGEEDGTPYLAMEYLEGVPLTTFAARPWTETVPLLVQAAHGLEYLSSRGIVHRDLSPDNVLVIQRGGERIVKLLDFGVAKMFERGAGLESLTATGFFLGKVAYGSPEQLGALGARTALDWRSDVYSLGVIFYQVLSGARPFEGKVPVEYIAGHLNVVPAPVAAPPGASPLPMEIVRLVAQMLEKRREDRPGSWREIVDRFVAVLRDSGAAVTTPSAPRPVPLDPSGGTAATALVSSPPVGRPEDPPTLRLRLRRRGPLVAVAAGLLVAVSLAVWIVRLADRPSTADPASAARKAGPFQATPKGARAATAPGRLQLLATPWARVVSITDIGRDKPLPLLEGAVTPYLALTVPPGTYRVVFTCPQLSDLRLERLVTVGAGETVPLAVTFLPTAALAERLR
ncbi:MAG TPA: protein kinase [Thermoanaerobaculia bacterium]|nr:protein kinase [Thermoanaerobaculia bacterium]